MGLLADGQSPLGWERPQIGGKFRVPVDRFWSMVDTFTGGCTRSGCSGERDQPGICLWGTLGLRNISNKNPQKKFEQEKTQRTETSGFQIPAFLPS